MCILQKKLHCSIQSCSFPILKFCLGKNLAFWLVGQLIDKYKYRSRSVWTMFSGSWGDFWACPVQGQKLNSMMFEGPFQLGSFYASRSTSLFCACVCVCVAVAHCGCSWAPHNSHWHWGTHVLPPSPPAFPELCEFRCWILYLWQLSACDEVCKLPTELNMMC